MRMPKNMAGKVAIPFFLLGAIGLLLISIGTLEIAIASTMRNDIPVQDPGEISATMSQASDNIQNELASQGDKLKNQLATTFGFNDIQSQLSFGYQSAFAGNTSGAVSHVKMADEALEKTVTSVFRSAEEVNRISRNNSLTLDNGTRQILSAVGSGLTDLGSEIRDQRTNLIGMLE